MFTQAGEFSEYATVPRPPKSSPFQISNQLSEKIQNGCQRKHIVIHVTIICSNMRATCARVFFFLGGGGGAAGGGESWRERSLPYLTPISQAGRMHPCYHSAIP